MEDKPNFLKNSQIIILGVCIAVATIVSTVILSRSLLTIRKFSSEVISVTGSAEKNIVSDFIVWRAEFSRRDPLLTSASALVKEDLKKVLTYLSGKGVQEKDVIIPQVETKILYKKNDKGNDTNDIQGYQLKQTVEVRSAEVQKITGISRQATELIDQDIEFISQAPEYFYTRLADLKVEMLARATENAKQRAENMARATGNRIGFMRTARMGVFQITPANSYEISDWGTNDTTSLEKKVTSVVNVSFSIAGA